MRKFAIPLISVAFLSLVGCGCLEKYTDPRFADRPFDGHPRDPIDFADSEQPAWHRCVFGTRWLRNAPGVNGGYPDPAQPTWQRRLFGPRYVPAPIQDGRAFPGFIPDPSQRIFDHSA